MTGEGITPGMESALLAGPVLAAALDAGRFDAQQLSAFERAFRAYFDPAMQFLDVLAAQGGSPQTIVHERSLGLAAVYSRSSSTSEWTRWLRTGFESSSAGSSDRSSSQSAYQDAQSGSSPSTIR